MKVHLQGWSIPDSMVLASNSSSVVWVAPVWISQSIPAATVKLRYIDTSGVSSYSNNFAFSYSVSGCTDQSAMNYDSLANCDDGSCIFTVLGCTDSSATNYNALANTDDGSCIPGCTGMTMQYPTAAVVAPGSCDSTVTVSTCNYQNEHSQITGCLLYTSPSPRDKRQSRMPSSA